MSKNKLQLPGQLLFRLLLRLGILGVLIYCSVCVILYFLHPKLIFVPSPNIETTPKQFNLNYKEVWLPVSNKKGKMERIHGWWIAAKESNAKVLLYLHGNGENIGANVAHANRFHQLGFSVLLIDYQGYGRSEGSFPTELQVYQDASIAWDYLVQREKVPPNQIFIYGHSLGGAIAIDLALHHPEAAGLIVESTFTSIREVIAYRNNYWMFPVDLILTQRFESIQKLRNVKMPILLIHGTADSTIPSFMSQKLYAIAPEPKKLILVPNAGHNNVAKVAGSQYLQWVQSFVQQVEKRSFNN